MARSAALVCDGPFEMDTGFVEIAFEFGGFFPHVPAEVIWRIITAQRGLHCLFSSYTAMAAAKVTENA